MVQDHFVRFTSPDELQTEALYYSDGMGFEDKESFYIDRTNFPNYLIMYTISGRLWCCQNEQKIAVNPGESVLLDLHIPHQYYFEENIPSRIAWAHINGTAAFKILGSIQKDRTLPFKISSPAVYDGLLSLFEVSDQPTQDIFRQSVLCYSLLLEFLKAAKIQENASSEHHRLKEFKQTVWQYISHNLNHDITLDELARYASLSKYHFIRKFQDAFHVPPMQFITTEKINYAKYLLRNTTEPISGIAESLGYATPSYFSKVFKHAVGISPTEYRNTES